MICPRCRGTGKITRPSEYFPDLQLVLTCPDCLERARAERKQRAQRWEPTPLGESQCSPTQRAADGGDFVIGQT